ncbi:class A sortase [Philodulcilactobacillus myokoensis]|uniref:Class A sortase n=1 Tax=Philodulcilactobacillus myokoensis TaxID=2929573 RepID=A0A9W6ES08_9LACO|nr:class A sortase [Philodulcilactobacillus myokoensis]GLB46370.1 class A sortase [Philodulcilactobacillus myokoensis]
MKKRYLIPAIILFLIGLILVFYQPIQDSLIAEMTSNHLSDQTVRVNRLNRKHESNFNLQRVKPVDAATVSKALFDHDDSNVIGKIVIPAVAMKLPIFNGLNNNDLIKGAGTMHPDQKMGSGNYALAGHHMSDNGILFGPLSRVTTGDLIYLSDGSKLYEYQVTKKIMIDKHQVNWIQPTNKPVVTLITCSSGNEGEQRRIMVRGKLIQSRKLTRNDQKLF